MYDNITDKPKDGNIASKKIKVSPIEEMTERAKLICPAFMFLGDVWAKDPTKYHYAYKSSKSPIPEVAKSCNALRVMDNRICPLVARGIKEPAEMERVCPMKGAFRFDEGAIVIARFAAALARNNANSR